MPAAGTEFPIDPRLVAAVESVYLRVTKSPFHFVESPGAFHQVGQINKFEPGGQRGLPRLIRESILAQIAERDGLRCVWCGTDFAFPSDATLDHLIPFQIVRHWEQWNLVVSCYGCNTHKGNRLPLFLMPLLCSVLAFFAKQAAARRLSEPREAVQLELDFPINQTRRTAEDKDADA